MVSEVVQVLILTSFSVCIAKGNSNTLPKIKRDTLSDGKPLPIEDLIRQAGYPVESHEITTEDGYLLTYHRIPYGKDSEVTCPGAPLLLQHGMLANSASWLVSDQSLGLSLADAGFDVWLGNTRGNTYSRKHVKLDPDKDKGKFWDFSWHEMGVYDLPAGIDYILRNTSNSRLSYIGHSMGTTMYFVMGSTRPEYMRKVNAAVALAPVAYLRNIQSPIVNFAIQTESVIKWVTYTLGMHVLFETPYRNYMKYDFICPNPYLQFICEYLFMEVSGYDEKQFDKGSFPHILDYFPAGVSVKALKHYRQAIDNGFNEYDYGPEINTKKYGSSEPPAYDMSLVTTPVYVWWAANDSLTGAESTIGNLVIVTPSDPLMTMHIAPHQENRRRARGLWHHNKSVEATVSHLPDVRSVTRVPDDEFTHMDFMWATDAKQLVYDDIIAILKPKSDNHNTYYSYNE